MDKQATYNTQVYYQIIAFNLTLDCTYLAASFNVRINKRKKANPFN